MVPIVEPILNEFREEVRATRRVLERVPPASANNLEEIRAAFEKNVRTTEELLSNMSEQTALGSWHFVFKGKEIFRKPRVAVLRTNLLNHLYHHRGQLSVYLRLLDVPVPVVYGPTAGQNHFA